MCNPGECVLLADFLINSEDGTKLWKDNFGVKKDI